MKRSAQPTSSNLGHKEADRGGLLSRILSRGNPLGWPFLWDNGLPMPRATYPGVDNGPGRPAARRLPPRGPPALLLYLVLLPAGFTEPGRSPDLLVSSYLTVSPLPPRPRPGW